MDFSFLKRFQGDGDDDDAEQEGQDDQDIGMNPGNAFDDDDDIGGGGGDYYDADDAEPMEGIERDGDLDGDAHGLHGGHAEAPVIVEDAFGDLDDQIAAQRAGPAVDDLVMETDVMMGKTHADMYEYFDAALMRNWAGPEHWKLRRIPKGKEMCFASWLHFHCWFL